MNKNVIIYNALMEYENKYYDVLDEEQQDILNSLIDEWGNRI